MVVAIANGAYTALRPLDRAVPDAAALVELLRERHGFNGVLLDDELRGELLIQVDRCLGEGSLRGGALVLVWTGHGRIGAHDKLELLGRATATQDGRLAWAEDLGEWAARTGAAQVLVVLDTCESGAGVAPSLSMADAVIAGRSDPSAAWFGVIAASRSDQTARSGVLASELRRLLSEGPRDEKLRLRWSAYDARVRGDDVIDALMKEWSEPRHSPQQAATGNPWPMLRNPLHRPRAAHRVVEHLLQAARGTSTEETFFTGREATIARLVAWMQRAKPGLCVVTGPAGSGKSAILGRLVSLSDREERTRLVAAGPIEAHLDPGERSVAGHVHCRGLDVKGTIEQLTGQMDLPDGSSIYDLLGVLARRRAGGSPAMLVLDGLDEADDSREVALQVVQPVARESLVLVGTREVPGGVGEPGLLSLLAAPETVDLGKEIEETLRDVHRYVVGRLTGVSATMNPEAVAAEIVTAARAHDPARDGPFLLARLVTSQLRGSPVDTGGEGWHAELATGVEAALERDLDRTVIQIAGRDHATAARELLRALACALGSGFPADDVWPIVATAISATGTTYSRDDVYDLLVALGRHVVAGSEGDQGVYRIAHQRLVDHLRPMIGQGLARRLDPVIAVPIGRAIGTLYEALLDQGQAPTQHTYLWRHAWRHCADAGPEGIEILRRLVARDRSSFLPDLALALARLGASSWWLGSPKDAVPLHEESVEIRRELGRPLELAMALFNLSFALGSSGDAASADHAAGEASLIARRAADQPGGSSVLAATLTAHALSQMRRGNARGAHRAAREAVTLADAELARSPDAVLHMVIAACGLAANAANALGLLQEADELSGRAISLLDQQDDETTGFEALLVDTLAIRAQTELTLLIARLGAPKADGSSDDAWRPRAAARIYERHRTRGATGTVADILTAEGLRLLAWTTAIEAEQGIHRPDAPEPRDVLDGAITLVAPLAEMNAEASIALASSLTARARVRAQQEPAQALSDLEEAERRLRPLADSAAVGVPLATALELRAILLSSSPEHLQAAIDAMREAVDLVHRTPAPVARRVEAEALDHLVKMLDRAGRTDEATAARQGLVDVHRQLLDGSDASALRLAALLVDVAAGVYLPRPIEAADFASEALSLLASIDSHDARVPTLRGLAELNRSGALLQLGKLPEARSCLERAVALLEQCPPVPVVRAALGTANCSLSGIHLQDLEFQAARERAQSALDLVEQAGSTTPVSVLQLARINLGRALTGLGMEQEGRAALETGIAELRATMSDDEAQILQLAGALNVAGPAIWDEVLADLHDNPSLAGRLRVLRVRPVEELSLTIRDLIDAMDEAGSDGKRLRYLRSVARQWRSRAPAPFDAAWTHEAGAIPAWLPIDSALENVLVAWWNTPTWRQSRAYLEANPVLLAPATDILIDEMQAAGAREDLATKHLELLRDARAQGIEQAYAPTLARIVVSDWAKSEYSAEFLADHLDELRQPVVSDVLRARKAGGEASATMAMALLTLACAGEQSAASRIRQDVAFGVTTLRQALRSDDAMRLEALANLCLASAEISEADQRLASTALAIAYALSDRPAEAVATATAVAVGGGDPAQRADLVAIVVDAIGRHADRRDALVVVLNALSASPSALAGGGPTAD
jgi:tetratricopeptide (TPR) repeat protein